jgi:hypothetical protein
MSSTAHLFAQTDGTTNIDTWLTQEAGRIGKRIYRHHLHTSPWTDLIKMGEFQQGMGYKLSTLIYERVLPNTGANASADAATLGLAWTDLGALQNSDAFTNSLGQNFANTLADSLGPQDAKSFLHFARSIKQYNLKKAVIESPRMSTEDLMFSFEGPQQLAAIMELMNEAVQRSWIERHRDEYDRACANLVPCMASSTTVRTTVGVSAGTLKEGTQTWAVDYNNDFVTSGVDLNQIPTAHVSNKILDNLRNRLVRAGAGRNAYGVEDGAPVFGLVISSEASYYIKTESGFREDVRKSPRVSELLAPLGVSGSFRGFYHIIDDLAPRMTIDGSTGVAARVYPETMTDGILSTNAAYETADYEVAYILHSEVIECEVPMPKAGAGQVRFDPLSYRGDFKWLNIPSENLNPDGTIGFFRGVLASASKLIKPRFGYAIVYKRTSTVPAA